MGQQPVNRVKHVAVRAHNPEASDVLSVLKGDELIYEKRKTTYPGWVWCTDNKGNQAWVPEAFVTKEENRCRMRRDYVSREMAIGVGDMLDVIEIESGWAWVYNREGENGWVPMECLERVAP